MNYTEIYRVLYSAQEKEKNVRAVLSDGRVVSGSIWSVNVMSELLRLNYGREVIEIDTNMIVSVEEV